MIICGDRLMVKRAWCADGAWSRMRGLLARPKLAGDATEALWLTPCSNIHTIGMRYALDIVFLDGDGRVLGWRTTVPPWRMRWCRRARHTVEFAAGALAELGIVRGERWCWQAERRQ